MGIRESRSHDNGAACPENNRLGKIARVGCDIGRAFSVADDHDALPLHLLCAPPVRRVDKISGVSRGGRALGSMVRSRRNNELVRHHDHLLPFHVRGFDLPLAIGLQLGPSHFCVEMKTIPEVEVIGVLLQILNIFLAWNVSGLALAGKIGVVHQLVCDGEEHVLVHHTEGAAKAVGLLEYLGIESSLAEFLQGNKARWTAADNDYFLSSRHFVVVAFVLSVAVVGD
mmetsp:Transcript_16455/g.34776  ORF Transcript_16455/g.34776 Transcript_16455/m.34776 type:complete len:227 (+) Transcript_16455:865-1545(+)